MVPFPAAGVRRAALLTGLAACLAAPSAADPSMVELSARTPAASQKQGTVAFTLAMDRTADGEAAPRLTVFERERSVATAVGVSDGWGGPQGRAGFVEMDRGNGTPEVLFTSYSGGAHCCTQVIVATRLANAKWTTVDFGAWDGDGAPVDDLDGDGVMEFAAPDQRFLYAFDCYACSAAPQQILTLENGRIRDRSRDERFVKAQQAYLKHLEAWHKASVSPAEFSPGFYAGYVAQMSLLGRGAEAWGQMLAAYDAGKDPGFEMCVGQPFPGECLGEQIVTVGYPEALLSFLSATGYGF